MPNFQTCEANLSKPRIDINTMFSLKVAQDPMLLFAVRKFVKIRLYVFLQRSFEKPQFFSVFHL